MSPQKKRKVGRPSSLTPVVQRKIVQAIRGGNYREVAAKWAGVSDRSVSNWMRDGEEATSGPYREFFLAVIEAEQAAEIRAVALIMTAAARDPKHAEWWLERKFQDRWGRRSQISGPLGGPIPIQYQLSNLDEAELLALRAILAKARP